MAQKVERGIKVGIHYGVPFFHGGEVGWFEEDGANAVGGGFDRAEFEKSAVDAVFNLLGFCEITNEGFDAEFCSEGSKAGFVPTSEDELGVGGCEFAGKSGANSSIGSGDEGSFWCGHYWPNRSSEIHVRT